MTQLPTEGVLAGRTIRREILDNDPGFRELVEAAPDAILEVDERGCILLVNEEAERLFRSSREELVGKLVEEFIPERFRPEHAMHRDYYGARPVKRPMGLGLDLWARRSDGSEFPVDIKLSPLQTNSGLRVMCIVRDISDRRAAEEQISTLNQSLEQRNREVERANRLKTASESGRYALFTATRVVLHSNLPVAEILARIAVILRCSCHSRHHCVPFRKSALSRPANGASALETSDSGGDLCIHLSRALRFPRQEQHLATATRPETGSLSPTRSQRKSFRHATPPDAS